MLVVGPEKFGAVHYYGTLPYGGVEGQADVLAATRNVAEANFVFDPANGLLVALEMTVDTDADPCEIRFGDYRDLNDRQVPHRMEVRHGDNVYGTIEWSVIELAAAAEEGQP
jgi:hypothetical protein